MNTTQDKARNNNFWAQFIITYTLYTGPSSFCTSKTSLLDADRWFFCGAVSVSQKLFNPSKFLLFSVSLKPKLLAGVVQDFAELFHFARKG